MKTQIALKPALAIGLATSLVAGIAVAAAPEAVKAPVSSGAVLDLSAVSGGGSGKVSLQDFSFSQSQAKRPGDASSSSACPSSSDSSRWKAPELNSSSDRSSSAPAGPACVAVVTAREAGSGQASGQRKGWDGCVKGSGIAHARLSSARSVYTLHDVTVEECTANGMVLSFKSVDRPAPQAAVPQRPGPRPTVSGSD